MALLNVIIGLLGAIGSIWSFGESSKDGWEQIFWACFLFVIAAFYLSFAAYFGASSHAWQTEIVGVVLFLVFAWVGCFPDSLSRLAMSCMGSGIYLIVCLVLRLRACR